MQYNQIFNTASLKTFGLTLQEGAEAARCDGCPDPQTNPIIVKNATKSINRKEEFNGVGWGLANGVCGLGFIFAIVAIISVHNEIKQIKDKKYAKYAKEQLNQFIITYVLCCVAWFAIGFAIGFFSV